MFTTDNGTAAGDAPRKNEEGTWRGFNSGMRGKKGSEFDGGHRVPFFAHWPAGGVVGGRDIDALTAHIDVLPTLVEMCGLEMPVTRALDGASFAQALAGDGAAPRGRTLFVHSQRIEHPRKWRKSAVMTERWRLVNGEQLFDVVADPGQRTDVAGAHADVVAALRTAYDGWWRSLEPVFDNYVRIDVGGAEDPVELMSHDWHSGDRGTPWSQAHVRTGYVGNGPWALEVRSRGDYEITLRRWPAWLRREMGCVHAKIAFAGSEVGRDIEPVGTHATFRVTLESGPMMLLTTLRREDGEEHGAYFASIRAVR